jgi:hypothetical protein
MNFQTILKHIKLYKGVSYSTLYGNLAGKEGFALSPYKDRERTFQFLTEAELKDYFVSNLDLLAIENHFLGAWVDNGLTYLDVSIFEPSKEKAIERAKQANQLAIFDLSKMETVYLPLTI